MKNIAINIFLTLASLLLIIGGMEIGARIYKGQYGFKNFLKARKNLFRSAYVSQFDRELGWVPKKGRHPKNIWKTRVTILDDGIRSNGEDTEKRSEDNVILAVGDSFTFGDQVSDNETWPAFLEKMSGRRVINGGVTGYGADQVFLRMKLLAGKFDPDIIIFGLIAKDIRRCEFSEFAGVKKPFFKLSKDRQLLLTTNHVSYFPSRPLSVSRRILGYSFIIHKLMVRTFPRYWLQGLYKNTIAHLNGEEVVCGIFNKLKDFARDNKIDIYVLIEYEKDGFEKNPYNIDSVINCIDRDALHLVDTRYFLTELKMHDPGRYDGLFKGHLTKAGNYLVASLLYQAITKQFLLLISRNIAAPVTSSQNIEAIIAPLLQAEG